MQTIASEQMNKYIFIKIKKHVPLVLYSGEETRLVRCTRWMKNRLELVSRGRN